MSQEEKESLHVNCLIDYLKNKSSDELENTAESIAVSSVINSPEKEVPLAIQYTRGVASFAQKLAKHEFKTVVLFDSQESLDFTSELLEGQAETNKNLMFIENPLSVEELAFPTSPNEEGWHLVILDDIVPYIGKDQELISLLRSITLNLSDEGYVVIRVIKPENKQSWSREYNDTVVTESIEKMGIRRYKRTFTSHGNVELREEENMYIFDVSDLHDCARNAGLRPTREMGLDPTSWCCYEKA